MAEKCACRVENDEQVAWCKQHNGWEYAREMDKLRQEAEAKVRAPTPARAVPSDLLVCEHDVSLAVYCRDCPSARRTVTLATAMAVGAPTAERVPSEAESASLRKTPCPDCTGGLADGEICVRCLGQGTLYAVDFPHGGEEEPPEETVWEQSKS